MLLPADNGRKLLVSIAELTRSDKSLGDIYGLWTGRARRPMPLIFHDQVPPPCVTSQQLEWKIDIKNGAEHMEGEVYPSRDQSWAESRTESHSDLTKPLHGMVRLG